MNSGSSNFRETRWRFELKAALVYWLISALLPGATYRRQIARIRRGRGAIFRAVVVRTILRFVLLDVVSPRLRQQVDVVDAASEQLREQLGRQPTWAELKPALEAQAATRKGLATD